MIQSVIDDASLAAAGLAKMEWYRRRMTVLADFKERYQREKPFLNKRILVCMHCEPKGALRTEVLLAGGASEIVFIGNLGSTRPEVAAYLHTLEHVTVLARQGDTLEDLNQYVQTALQEPFDLIMDNGASVTLPYTKGDYPWKPIGAIEETRSGKVLWEKEGIQPDYPMLVIDDSLVKRLIENEVGVGQSVVDGFMRATSMLLGGKKILVIGYGYCGLGIAHRFRALGAITMVHDKAPLRKLKAKIDGHIVGEFDELIAQADAVITVTGHFDVVGIEQARLLKNGAILCNAGHYNMEIKLAEIKAECTSSSVVNENIVCMELAGKTFYVIQNGNPINLSAGAGNPIEIMELGYALQLLSLEAILQDKTMKNGIHPLPEEVNNNACQLCLDSWV